MRWGLLVVMAAGMAGASGGTAKAGDTAYSLYNDAFPGRMTPRQFDTISRDREAFDRLIADVDAEFELSSRVDHAGGQSPGGSGRTTTAAASTTATRTPARTFFPTESPQPEST